MSAPPTAAAPAVLTVAPATPAAKLSRQQFLALVAYWVAIGYLWQSLGTLILPDAVERLVGSAAKGTGLSVLEGIGTVIAIVWQPVAGTLSDRTHTRWGRRRPYLVGGTAADLVFLVGLALAGSFWPLVVAYTFLQFS
nr:MFS transporter [Candidatus Dormibacteraeota bacterium]